MEKSFRIARKKGASGPLEIQLNVRGFQVIPRGGFVDIPLDPDLEKDAAILRDLREQKDGKGEPRFLVTETPAEEKKRSKFADPKVDPKTEEKEG
jgi:hypothetical protein